MGDVPEGSGRGFGTGMHAWRRTEKSQTQPLVLYNSALSWPQSSHRFSQCFSDGRHLSLSLAATTLIVKGIFHFFRG